MKKIITFKALIYLMKTDYDESLSADKAGIGNINIIP